jgi:CRISPR system Cascade subunit CasD
MSANTLFLRLEGPLQAWGDQQSKFLIRRTAEAPTKSGVIGILCAALGVSRIEASDGWLPKLCALSMGVRLDRPGVRWWDYHTIGAGMDMRTAEGGKKPGAMLTRREYLCDASFLVALQGEPGLVAELEEAIKKPHWTLYLGRKSCPPARPLLEPLPEERPRHFPDLLAALTAIPWRRRLKGDQPPPTVDCLRDWEPKSAQTEAPEEALIWYDVPFSFEPPAHQPRFVLRRELRVGGDGELRLVDEPVQKDTPAPLRPRADYWNTEYRMRRQERLNHDHHLCLFCKSPATTVQHITYRRAGGHEAPDDLRSLCRLCHDAVTMIEYGLGMGLDRINPEEPRWRHLIIRKRGEIIRFRSLETRRRHLAAEEVE